MKTKTKLLACLLAGLSVGCQTRIEYTKTADSEKIIYRQPLLTKRSIKSLKISGDETSRNLELEGYQINPEFEALNQLIGTAIRAGVEGAGKAVAP